MRTLLLLIAILWLGAYFSAAGPAPGARHEVVADVELVAEAPACRDEDCSYMRFADPGHARHAMSN